MMGLFSCHQELLGHVRNDLVPKIPTAKGGGVAILISGGGFHRPSGTSGSF